MNSNLNTKIFKAKFNKKDNDAKAIINNEDFIENIFKVLSFYVKDDVYNSLIGGSIIFLSLLKKIPEKYCNKFFEYCDLVYSSLIEGGIEMTFTVKYIREIKNYFNLISETNPKRYECLNSMLTIIYNIMMNLKSKHFMSSILVVRKIMIEIFNEFELLEEYKSFLIKKADNLIEKENKDREKLSNMKNNSNLDVTYGNASENQPKDKEKERGESNMGLLERLREYTEANSQIKQHQSMISNNSNINNEFVSKNKNCIITSSLAEAIYIKFIRMLNIVFDDNATFHNEEFLEEVLDKGDIIKILKNKITLNLELRTELIKYYRMIYVDVSIINRRLSNYRLAFISVPDVEENENLVTNNDAEIFNFLDNIISISQADEVENQEEGKKKEKDNDYELLMEELRNFKLIVECTGKNSKAILYYFEQALVLPIKIYMNKFFSQGTKKKGPDIIRIYVMIIHTLLLKYFIIENNIINKAFNDDSQSKSIVNFFSSNSDRNIENPTYRSNEEKGYKYSINECLPNKESSILVHNKFLSFHAKKIENSMQELLDTRFKVYDYVNLYRIVNTHFLSCVKEHASHEMVDYDPVKPDTLEVIIEKVSNEETESYNFQNQNSFSATSKSFSQANSKSFNNIPSFSPMNSINLNQSEIADSSRKKISSKQISKKVSVNCGCSAEGKEKKYEFIKKLGLSKNQLQQIGKRIYELFLVYDRQKRNFEESSIISVLREVQIQYDLTLRNILLRYLFTVASDDDYELSIVSKNAYFIIFKLLQYDTENTQKEVESIINHSPGIINLELLADTFFKNVLSVFLSAYNPIGIEVLDDYETSYNIIKIFKMMAESSFQLIQGIVVRYLRFDYGDTQTKITLFDFLLVIVMKMLTLSRWDRNSAEEREKSEYLKEIFTAIMELLIEVIQGNSMENLNSLLDQEESYPQITNNENNEKMLSGGNLISIQENNTPNIPTPVYAENRKKKTPANKPGGVKTPKNKTGFSYKYNQPKQNKGNAIYGKLCVLPQFLIFIQKLLFDDSSNSIMIYEVRKQMLEFYLAFLEDTNCPLHIKNMIIEQINLTKVISSLKNTMKKFYIKRVAEKIEHKKKGFLGNILPNFNFMKNEKEEKEKEKEEKKEEKKSTGLKYGGVSVEPLSMNRHSSEIMNIHYDKGLLNSNSNSKPQKRFYEKGGENEESEKKQSPTFLHKIVDTVMMNQPQYEFRGKIYSEIELDSLFLTLKIDKEIYNYYEEYFYKDNEFYSSIELEFSCLLFRYIKLLEINFDNSELKYFLSKYTTDKEKDIIENYNNKNIHVQNKPEGLVNDNITIDLDEHFENLQVLKFFNGITKIVEVERADLIIKVVFTINPEFSLVTEESRNIFLNEIPRNNRFSKLTYLLTSSVSFFNEIEYFKKQRSSALLTRFGNWMNYNFVILIVFIVTVIVNTIMLCVIDGTFKMTIWNNGNSSRRLNSEGGVDSNMERNGNSSSNYFKDFQDFDLNYDSNESKFTQVEIDSTFIPHDFHYMNYSTASDIHEEIKENFNGNYLEYFKSKLHSKKMRSSSEIIQKAFEKNNTYARRSLQIGLDYQEYKLPQITEFGAKKESVDDWLPIYGGIALGMAGLLDIVAILWILVKLPLMYNNRISYLKVVKKIDFDKKSNLYKFYVLFFECLLASPLIYTTISYNFLAVIGVFTSNGSWAFAFCLLIVVNISDTIRNVFNALAMRWSNLIMAFVFQITVMYAYSNITFYYFNELLVTKIDGELYYLCESLISCMLITLDFGFRRHSGLGEIIPKASFNYETAIYMSKFFFETSFYIVITVIIMNIVFGIIIDTFRELRITSREIDHEKENVCLICGAKKEDLERNRISFSQHVNYSHDVWNYIQYMIKIMNSSPQDLTSINFYAYQMINAKLIHWFPSTCFELKEQMNKENGVEEEEYGEEHGMTTISTEN